MVLQQLVVTLGATAVIQAWSHIAAPPLGSPEMYRDSLHLMFETVRKEADGDVLPITSGSMPTWLNGAKINNGFGLFEGGPKGKEFKINHLADVMSHYSKFVLSNGTVRLWNKIQHTMYWKQAQKGIPPFRTFNGTTPDMDPALHALAMVNMAKPNDNLNVGTIQLNVNAPDRMFGNSDMKGFNEADASMNYVGWLEFEEVNKPHLFNKLGMIDMISCTHIGNTLGDKYIYGYNYLIAGEYTKFENLLSVWRIDMTQPSEGPGAKLKREWLGSVPMKGFSHLSYMHAIANTPNYLVFIGSVFQYNVLKVVTHTRLLNAMEYHDEEKNMVWVFEKKSGQFVKTFTADPFWFYHFVNVYEDGRDVVMDFNSVDYRHIETAFSVDNLKNDAPWEFQSKPTLRLVVNLDAADGTNFSPTEIGPSYDLSTIHPNLHGQKYRWSWGLGWTGKSLWYDTIIKHDVTNRKVVATWHRKDHYPGELNFVPKPGATTEDDGVLLTAVLGGDYGASYLLVLDAKDLKPIAEARAAYPLPFGSHGCWQPADSKQGCIGETTADPFGSPALFEDSPSMVVV